MSEFSDAFVAFGNGRKAGVGALKNEALAAKLRRYKISVAKRYRVLEPDALSRSLPTTGQMWISTKVDGELWFLVKQKGEVALCAYNGRVLQGVPVSQEAEKLLAKSDDLIIPGELFAIPSDGRPRSSHVGKALADPKLAETLGFKAFDLSEEGGEDRQGLTYDKRYKRLGELFEGGKRAALVTTAEGKVADAATYFKEWVASQKFEGLVVRSEQGLTYKVKPTFTMDAVVVAFGERMEGTTPQIRELQLALRRDDGSLQVIGPVGGGFSEEDRAAWHQRLSKLEVPSGFRMANREGTLCRFVKPEIVVEVRCSDLLETDALESPVKRMSVKYEDGKGYSAVGATAVAAMVHPVFLRVREDKVPDAANIGMEQIWSRLPGEVRPEESAPKLWTPAKIVERAAYVKITKGATAVRKYVAIETNKSGDPNYPPFVVHFTDFSAGRQEPLKTSLRVASSKAAVDAHVKAWLEENVKKGWNPFGG